MRKMPIPSDIFSDNQYKISHRALAKLGGYDCFIELKKINPEVKAVVSSGFALNGEAKKIVDQGFWALYKNHSIWGDFLNSSVKRLIRYKLN